LAHEEVVLERVGREFDGSVVGAERLVALTCSCEKVGAGSMVGLVVIESGGVDFGESGEPLGGPRRVDRSLKTPGFGRGERRGRPGVARNLSRPPADRPRQSA